MFFGGVMIFLSLSTFDLFHIALPNNIVKLPKHKKHDYHSTFLLGLVSGLVVGPCVTSVLGAILAYIAARKNIFYGATLLFSFAYGMGMILIITGTFSGVLMNLPRPGKWMVNVKRMVALVILAMGVYFIYQGIRRL
jgi:thiol:disulfide interchange protein DsbD